VILRFVLVAADTLVYFFSAVAMITYHSKSGKNSGIEAYEIGRDYIRVKFKPSQKIYKYSYRSAGKMAVEQMKSLALEQEGLSTFISRHNPPCE
jgi:hypothetical protein